LSFVINKKQTSLLIKTAADIWHPLFVELLPKYDINSTQRVAAFVAQCSHESANFTVLRENLNYSADGLNKVFAKYFVRAGRDAGTYARNPEKIANVVYANRMGNGDVSSGDGWRFRGRGVIQLTGRDNYTAFGKSVRLTTLETIDYLETRRGALESACWYWKINNLNKWVDINDFDGLSDSINLGRKTSAIGDANGFADRKARFIEYCKVLGA
jgi:putative chitinase